MAILQGCSKNAKCAETKRVLRNKKVRFQTLFPAMLSIFPRQDQNILLSRGGNQSTQGFTCKGAQAPGDLGREDQAADLVHVSPGGRDYCAALGK